HGTVYDCAVQEIDVGTGKVLLDWRALDHVPIAETRLRPAHSPSPFDWFHVSSVSLYGPDALLVSASNTSTLYRVARSSGEVLERIGGRRSDYTMGRGASFSFQHDARVQPGGLVSLLDNGSTSPGSSGPPSRAIVLALDAAHKSARLLRSWTHPAGLAVPSGGSVQPLGTGGAFVGWGAQPYFTEFAGDGAIVFDARLATDVQSYRALISPWVGRPPAEPDVAYLLDALSQLTVYVSWNGATEVASWQVLSGPSASKLTGIATVPSAGFQTTITTRPTGPYVATAALDAAGKQLGRTRPQRVST
ncbi:MAG TPA: arylsulfotransferase family protein, partial [Acidimicrobiales bacterium]|nr:arylsulfotransferase family protein [Acidimicrobiales bacterium]